MPTRISIPKLGLTMTDATIVKWLVSEGETVVRGAPLLEIETDKITAEVESPDDGIVTGIKISAGEAAKVGDTIGWLVSEGEEIPPEKPSSTQGESESKEETSELPSIGSSRSEESNNGPLEYKDFRLTPNARRLVEEHGLNLQELAHTLGKNRISGRDIQSYIETQEQESAKSFSSPLEKDKIGRSCITSTASTPLVPTRQSPRVDLCISASDSTGETLPEGRIPFIGIRATIAERMRNSLQQTAPVTLTTHVDATSLVQLRHSLNVECTNKGRLGFSYNDILVMITAFALQEHNLLNATLVGDEILQPAHINIGMAVDTQRGLMVPVVKDADSKSLLQISQELRDLVGRAKTRGSLPEDLEGGTFTISNLGMFGVDSFTPIINWPQCAILGIGTIKQEPVVLEGTITVRSILTLSLTFDHRLVDGAPAARFLQRVKQIIETPYLLLA